MAQHTVGYPSSSLDNQENDHQSSTNQYDGGNSSIKVPFFQKFLIWVKLTKTSTILSQAITAHHQSP